MEQQRRGPIVVSDLEADIEHERDGYPAMVAVTLYDGYGRSFVALLTPYWAEQLAAVVSSHAEAIRHDGSGSVA